VVVIDDGTDESSANSHAWFFKNGSPSMTGSDHDEVGWFEVLKEKVSRILGGCLNGCFSGGNEREWGWA
jgi:hypothetical protein